MIAQPGGPGPWNDPRTEMSNPIKGGTFRTEHAAAAIVIGSLILLIMISKGFRGASIGGASFGLK